MTPILLAIGASVSMSSCAIHPLPDDVTNLSTYNIVRQIRCETREAVIDSLFTFLTSSRNHDAGKVDDKSREIGLSFQALYENGDHASIERFDPAALSGSAKLVVGLLWSTGIAYNYDLNMVEVNNIDSSLSVLRALPHSGVTLGLSAGLDRERGNERTFTITDNFGALVNKVDARYCTGKLVEANVIYPIAGKVGMKRVIEDFLMLALFGNLAGDGKDVTNVKGPPTMVEQLEFRTAIGGSATPKATFAPVGDAFHVAEASIGLTGSRTDTHKLTVGLYLDTSGVKQLTTARPDIFLGLIAATGGPAEVGAATAVDQFLRQTMFRDRN
ncbi:hypothetical protein FJ936_09230 [Mesorhizobium sp. B2-4-13]|uniref:hypothetical protein n=1 Tax=Mesorhizobium sp. B2-4-13 TaxID=2589936 RepID=UPI00114EE7A1|nr:hypothetical protein [Mesorhizobium sp. B2-4-13]TPK85710.1 hypothetical protein FJ936_09230 [Mesorhizobium sp. B2-4-13]